MESQALISEENNSRKSGRTFRTLTEGWDGYAKLYFGRTEADAPDIDGKIFFSSQKPLSPGDFTDVTVTGTLEYDLLGKVI